MLDEAVFADEVEKVLFRCEIIFAGILLARSRSSRCVWLSVRHTSPDSCLERRLGCHRRETENPNLLGYSAKSRLRSVDLPAPEGPDTTTGRNFCTKLLAHDYYGLNANRDSRFFWDCIPALVAMVETVLRGKNGCCLR